MKQIKLIAGAMMLLMCSSFAAAQMSKTESQPTVTSVFDQGVSSLEREFVPAAEAMPADKYSFAPTNGDFKGVRTFAQQVKHVAATNFHLGAVVMGEKPPAEAGTGDNGPDSIQSKEQILKYLQDSFIYLHKAMGTLTEKNMLDPLKAPWGQNTTRLNLAVLLLAHPMDHYGQMVEYLRMNNIIPPASRPRK